MRLNQQDGGRRQSIMVTNNEVSADEADERCASKGLRPGDPEWEALGICEHITQAAHHGRDHRPTPDGEPIKGDYKFTDEFPMADGFEENVEFFDLTYEDPSASSHGLGFEAIAPLLWLRAGGEGRRDRRRADEPFDGGGHATGCCSTWTRRREFVSAVRGGRRLRIAFVVTDDETQFQVVAAELPARRRAGAALRVVPDNFR